ncbi:MAG: MFS transporter [Candidatus Thorarchaeota archaeon]|nr:MAG: MFS transporter [Candidatus Thorarchaeota archaeon]
MSQVQTRVTRQMLLLCILGALAIFSTTMAKSPVLPYFASELGATDQEMGFIGAASPAMGILISVPVGVLMDRKGPKLLLWAAAFLFAFVPFLYFFVTIPLQLLIVRFVHGLATAILGPVALAVVAGLYGTRRGERMALYSSSTRVGRMIAPLVGGFLLAIPVFDPYGIDVYRGVYLLCGLSGMGVLALTLVMPFHTGIASIEPNLKIENKSQVSFRAVLRRDILLICTAQAATFFLFGAYEFFMPLYWKEVAGAPEWLAGPLLTLLTVTLLVVGPIIGRVSDNRGRVPFIVFGLCSLSLLTIIASAVPNMLLQILLIIPVGIAIAATDSTTSPLVTERVDTSMKGTALGLLSTIMDVGHSAGPLFLGLLLALGGHSYIFAFVIVSTTLLVVPILVFVGLHSRTLDDEIDSVLQE